MSGLAEAIAEPADTPDLRKTRGAFFTPPAIARFVAAWAVRTPGDSVIEPSCGEAVFLHEVPRGHIGRLVGVEVHQTSAAIARRTLSSRGIQADIRVGDFFDHEEIGAYDAAIGNPPYVRYQGWSGEARARSRAAALRAGVNLTNLASSWAAFTIHSALHLRTGGRLGVVLPAELLSVNYAAPVRRFLLEHFSEVSLVLFEERVFPGVEVDALLLLADGYNPSGEHGTDHMGLIQLRDASELSGPTASRRWTPPSKGAKWSAGMLSAAGSAAYGQATTAEHFTGLRHWGATTLGMVTGNNNFFALTPSKAADLGLKPSDVIPLSPPGSRHLRGLSLTAEALEKLGRAGQATRLFRPVGEPSSDAWHYIASGEALDVHTAYKCRVREPWWRVPYLKPADLLLTYMNADTPRLSTNTSGAHHLNSVHGVYLHDEHRELGQRFLPIASLNSVTLLGAETVGRAYGGGMLKIEPREADDLPVPSPGLIAEMRETLMTARPKVAAALRNGKLLSAVEIVDHIVLRDGLGMSDREVAAIRSDRSDLVARRVARAKDRSRG